MKYLILLFLVTSCVVRESNPRCCCAPDLPAYETMPTVMQVQHQTEDQRARIIYEIMMELKHSEVDQHKKLVELQKRVRQAIAQSRELKMEQIKMKAQLAEVKKRIIQNEIRVEEIASPAEGQKMRLPEIESIQDHP